MCSVCKHLKPANRSPLLMVDCNCNATSQTFLPQTALRGELRNLYTVLAEQWGVKECPNIFACPISNCKSSMQKSKRGDPERSLSNQRLAWLRLFVLGLGLCSKPPLSTSKSILSAWAPAIFFVFTFIVQVQAPPYTPWIQNNLETNSGQCYRKTYTCWWSVSWQLLGLSELQI